LYFDRAANRVDHTRELDQEAIAGSSDDATAVLLDLRIGDCVAEYP
jgi:hypothetical protein